MGGNSWKNMDERFENYDKSIEDIITRIEDYERVRENLKNNNAEIESIKLKLKDFEKDEENLRNNNAEIESMKSELKDYGKVEENLRNNNAEIESIKSKLKDFEKAEENLRNNNAEIEGIKSKLKDFEKVEENLRNNNEILESLIARLDNMTTTCELQKVKISMLEKKLKSHDIDRKITITGYEAGAVCENKSQDAYSGIDYFDFENHFRGSIKHIREAQEFYINYFKGHQNVIDLGCGRGEFLELLRENEIDAQGVDLYEEFVEMCRLKKLKVTQADAIEFLKMQENVGGIFAAQLIEHISTAQLVTLCETAYEKLEVGGYIILETPNPQSLSVFTNSFYIDPSHNKPVHPLTLQYIMEKAGFKEIEIVYTKSSRPQITIPPLKLENMDEFNHAMKQVEDMLFGSQDYAIVARR